MSLLFSSKNFIWLAIGHKADRRSWELSHKFGSLFVLNTEPRMVMWFSLFNCEKHTNSFDVTIFFLWLNVLFFSQIDLYTEDSGWYSEQCPLQLFYKMHRNILLMLIYYWGPFWKAEDITLNLQAIIQDKPFYFPSPSDFPSLSLPTSQSVL